MSTETPTAETPAARARNGKAPPVPAPPAPESGGKTVRTVAVPDDILAAWHQTLTQVHAGLAPRRSVGGGTSSLTPPAVGEVLLAREFVMAVVADIATRIEAARIEAD